MSSRLISLGIGSPASIPAFLTFGLLGDGGGTPPVDPIPVSPSSYVGGHGPGGGGSIYYQVPRAKLTLKQRPNDHLDAIISANEVEHMFRTLINPERASPKMIAETQALLAPFKTAEGYDFQNASLDPTFLAAFQAVWERYNAKLKALWASMREEGEDPKDFH